MAALVSQRDGSDDLDGSDNLRVPSSHPQGRRLAPAAITRLECKQRLRAHTAYGSDVTEAPRRFDSGKTCLITSTVDPI